MGKTKENRLDFNVLFELYLSGDQEKINGGRTLLYENMDRFLTGGKVFLDYGLNYGYDDIKQDMFIYIDERITSSIDKGFSCRETFNYIKCRVRNTLLNFVNPTRSGNNIRYFGDYGDEIDSVETETDSIGDMMVINDAVLGLSEVQQKIILLKYLSGKDVGLVDISKYIGKSLYETTIEHGLALLEIRKKVGMSGVDCTEMAKVMGMDLCDISV